MSIVPGCAERVLRTMRHYVPHGPSSTLLSAFHKMVAPDMSVTGDRRCRVMRTDKASRRAQNVPRAHTPADTIRTTPQVATVPRSTSDVGQWLARPRVTWKTRAQFPAAELCCGWLHYALVPSGQLRLHYARRMD